MLYKILCIILICSNYLYYMIPVDTWGELKELKSPEPKNDDIFREKMHSKIQLNLSKYNYMSLQDSPS